MRSPPRMSVLALLLPLSLPAAAQTDAIEDVEGGSERSPAALRAEIRTLERNMFALYNSLNSNDDFDVTCDFFTPTGSKIPVWHCDPAFMRVAESAEFMQMEDNRAPNAQGLGGIAYVPQNRRDIGFIQREKAEQMQSELRALALANPELATAIVTLHARRLQLAELEGESNE